MVIGAAHRFGQVPPADADTVRDSLSEREPRARRPPAGRCRRRRRSRSDRAGPRWRSRARRPFRYAVPQSGPMQSKPAADGEALERDLVLEGDVVAEQEDVQTVAQRRHRLERGVGAGHGHEREVGVRELPERRLEGPGRTRPEVSRARRCWSKNAFAAARADSAAASVSASMASIRSPGAAPRAPGAARPAAARSSRFAGVPMSAADWRTPGPLVQRCRQPHEHHGVLIEGAPDLDPDRHDPYR